MGQSEGGIGASCTEDGGHGGPLGGSTQIRDSEGQRWYGQRSSSIASGGRAAGGGRARHLGSGRGWGRGRERRVGTRNFEAMAW